MGTEPVSKFTQEYGTEEQLELLEIEVGRLGAMRYQSNEVYARLECVAGYRCTTVDAHTEIGPLTVSANVATICDAKQFENSRDLAAWLGMTLPVEHN